MPDLQAVLIRDAGCSETLTGPDGWVFRGLYAPATRSTQAGPPVASGSSANAADSHAETIPVASFRISGTASGGSHKTRQCPKSTGERVWQGFGKSAYEGMVTVGSLPAWTVRLLMGLVLP